MHEVGQMKRSSEKLMAFNCPKVASILFLEESVSFSGLVRIAAKMKGTKEPGVGCRWRHLVVPATQKVLSLWHCETWIHYMYHFYSSIVPGEGLSSTQFSWIQELRVDGISEVITVEQSVWFQTHICRAATVTFSIHHLRWPFHSA